MTHSQKPIGNGMTCKNTILICGVLCNLIFFSAYASGATLNNANLAVLSTTPCASGLTLSDTPAPEIKWPAAFPSLPNIDLPSSLFQLPGNDNYWYVLRQIGTIARFENKADANSLVTVLDIRDRVKKGGNEAGLLGVAIHPQFATNRFVFLFYTGASSSASSVLETRITRYRSNTDGTFDPASELLILRISRPFNNHQGGQLAFDSKGFLYIASGDGGSGGDPQQNGQNLNNLLGKILRIDINNTSAGNNYAIPSDNPFVGRANVRPEIWAWGLRNPWRFSFDRINGELWAGDVGQNAWEEINLITKGGNFGWGDMEGESCYRERPNCSTADKIKPLHVINHDNGSCSVTGGYVYRGAMYPSAYGKYFFTDYCASTIMSIARSTNGALTVGNHGALAANIVSFAENNQGELYALGQASGKGKQIYKLNVHGENQSPCVM